MVGMGGYLYYINSQFSNICLSTSLKSRMQITMIASQKEEIEKEKLFRKERFQMKIMRIYDKRFSILINLNDNLIFFNEMKFLLMLKTPIQSDQSINQYNQICQFNQSTNIINFVNSINQFCQFN